MGALEGWAWGGVSPPQRERVWGGGCAPSPENFRIFGVKITGFDAFLVLFLTTD